MTHTVMYAVTVRGACCLAAAVGRAGPQPRKTMENSMTLRLFLESDLAMIVLAFL
jgi:hypothetical protein